MKKINFILAFIFIAGNLFAQKFVASASKTRVAVGEQFQITYSLNSNGSGFRAPSLKDFDIYSGPNQSSSMQFINGNMSQSISFSYIVAAKKEGKFTIPPATVNSSLESNSLVIDVSKGGSSNGNSQGQNQNQSSKSSTETSDNNLFAKTIVTKTKIYQGEQITVTHKVYTTLSLRGFQDIKFPSYNGFWSQEVVQKNQINLTNENVNGIGYNVAEIKKSFLFPQRSGTIEIEPIEVECIIRQRSNKRPQSVFDQFFGNGGYEDVVYKVKSKPMKIEVLPLPENNKPDFFSGAVGNFSFKAQLNKDKVKANDAVNLTITISGKGNLKLLDPLKINFPEDIERYDPKISDNITVNESGVSGTKTFEYLMIPRHAGEYKIDQLNFSYFDPEKKTYVSLPSPEFLLSVEKGSEKGSEKDNEAEKTMTTAVNKEDIKLIGSDIRYIKTGIIDLKKKDQFFFGSPLFIAGVTSPVLLFILFLFARKRHTEINKDQITVKSRKARKIALKRLELANVHLKNDNKEELYNELLRAWYGYLSDRLNIPVADLSKESILNSLQGKGVNMKTGEDLIAILDNCEFARYAPGAVSKKDLADSYTGSLELLTAIENEIKN